MAGWDAVTGDGRRIPYTDGKVELTFTDLRVGAMRISIDGGGASKPIPFAFGPFVGMAHLVGDPEMNFGEGNMTVQLEARLVPAEDWPTVAELLEAMKTGVTVDE